MKKGKAFRTSVHFQYATCCKSHIVKEFVGLKLRKINLTYQVSAGIIGDEVGCFLYEAGQPRGYSGDG
jgi:hypothetical protein